MGTASGYKHLEKNFKMTVSIFFGKSWRHFVVHMLEGDVA
jgi:hypothetical protein